MSVFEISKKPEHLRARDEIVASFEEKLRQYVDLLWSDDVGGDEVIAQHVVTLLGHAAASVYVGLSGISCVAWA